MPLSSPDLRRFVRRALADVIAFAAPTPTQIASAFDLLCEQLRAQLQPLFGATAISALFARGHYLAAAEFAWLAEVQLSTGEHCALSHEDVVRAAVTADALQDGLAALLAYEIGLLSAFIGEDFVLPLVQQAWGASTPAVPPPPMKDHYE
jgi:hypothetical protein